MPILVAQKHRRLRREHLGTACFWVGRGGRGVCTLPYKVQDFVDTKGGLDAPRSERMTRVHCTMSLGKAICKRAMKAKCAWRGFSAEKAEPPKLPSKRPVLQEASRSRYYSTGGRRAVETSCMISQTDCKMKPRFQSWKPWRAWRLLRRK